MTVLLNRAYAGYNAGAIVQFSPQEEAALIQQNIATNSVAAPTTGNFSTNMTYGRFGVAAGQSTVVITNPQFSASSRFIAYLSQAAADGTATFVSRIVPAAGSVSIILNANATGAVTVDWNCLNVSGEYPFNAATV